MKKLEFEVKDKLEVVRNLEKEVKEKKTECKKFGDKISPVEIKLKITEKLENIEKLNVTLKEVKETAGDASAADIDSSTKR